MPKKKTTEDFILEAIKIHGNKYDYSSVEYKNTNLKVIIKCKIHGLFEQTPHSHLNKNGCPKCIGMNKNNDEYIEQLNKIHRNKYDYSLTKYINAKTKIKIICPIHGLFEQIPYTHLLGTGCPKCAIEKNSNNQRSNTNNFIEKAKKIHGDKYDYSLVDYITAIKKVKIICSDHGEFTQTPNKHLMGKGCPKCHGKNKTIEEYIEEVNKIHNYKYNYSLVNNIKTINKIKIICKEHGEFEQNVSSHLSGAGCPYCAGNIISNNDDFIEKAKKIHGDKYDYSLVNYKGANIKVEIICNKINHNNFKVTPYHHLNSIGCPICSESHGERLVRNILTKYNINFETQKKFKYCKNIHKLPFDFYLPDYNICIEYDGKQHYEAIKRFGGEKSFNDVQRNDEIKTNFCENNNIYLIRIPYTEKNIESILIEELKKKF